MKKKKKEKKDVEEHHANHKTKTTRHRNTESVPGCEYADALRVEGKSRKVIREPRANGRDGEGASAASAGAAVPGRSISGSCISPGGCHDYRDRLSKWRGRRGLERSAVIEIAEGL